jgi:hypothetical protein
MPALQEHGQCRLCLGWVDWAELAENAGCCGECAAYVVRCRTSVPGLLGACPNRVDPPAPSGAGADFSPSS